MTNLEIVRLLRAVTAVFKLKGESFFRIRAYENAADNIEHATRELKDIWEDGKLQTVPGIGANLSSHLEELFSTGSVNYFSQLFKDIPESVFEYLEIPGIGPKNALKLAKALGISRSYNAIKRLKQAAIEGKIQNIESFGKKSEKAILNGIEEYLRREEHMLLPQAVKIAKDISEFLKKDSSVLECTWLGSLRRRSATIGDVDIAISSRKPGLVIERFTKYPQAKQILAAGKNTARLIHKNGTQIDIKIQTPAKFGALLQHFTGSKNHNIHLRELAKEKGLSLSEHGIKVGKYIKAYASEQLFYNALGMDWIPPELREDQGEIEAALIHNLPTLVKTENIKGDLHLHTNFNWISSHDNGDATMKQMADKALVLGYEYVGIGDHNPSLRSYTKNQIMSEIKRRTKAIEQLRYSYENINSKRTIHLLNTLEVDILADGNLAAPTEGLNMLDYASVSIHSSMRMIQEKMTDRIIKGLSHPKAKILAHPSGRLLNKREGYEVNWDMLFKFAAEHNKWLEINAWPSRLDLQDTLVREAINYGVQLVINTDAHSPDHMDLMRYGVDVARRGWASANSIINTRSWKQFSKLIENH